MAVTCGKVHPPEKIAMRFCELPTHDLGNSDTSIAFGLAASLGRVGSFGALEVILRSAS